MTVGVLASAVVGCGSGRASGPAHASTLEARSPLPSPDSDGVIPVPPSHPLVAYVGRVDLEAPGGPLLGFVGASVTLRFIGTGLTLRLKDYGTGTPATTNYYDVTVDGAPPRLLAVTPEQERYVLAHGLTEGEHTIELFKRGESAPGGVVGAGRANILGFLLHGSALLPVDLPARKLEFVGDSITCGYGNEVSTWAPDDFPYTTRASNGHEAYGALTAQLLGARYSAVAYSGRGMSRSYAGGPGQILPELYLDSVPEDPSARKWDPARYVPDAVIINLGTNDFSTPGVDRARFVDNYTRFLATLRAYYPSALLVAALGPMLTDSSPPGAMAWTNARADVQAAVQARLRTGDTRVHFMAFPPQTGPFGEDWHPTVATHRAMATQLARELKGWLGW